MGYTWKQMASIIAEGDNDTEAAYLDVLAKMVNKRLATLPAAFQGVKRIDDYAFTGVAINEIPGGVEHIGVSSFMQCPQLKIVEVPETVKTIGKFAFKYCSHLTTVTFGGTPTELAEDVFYACDKLTTINVPWAENEVANAPWGATEATINYNYVEE